MKSPRGVPAAGAAGSAAAESIDFVSFTKERREGLTKYGSLTQDVMQAVQSTMKNAIASGQPIARIQTLHLTQHYSYSKTHPFPSTSRILHDDMTMEAFANVRVNLAERPRELVEWLEDELGIPCICSCLKIKEELCFGMPSLAPHMYVVALLHRQVAPTVLLPPPEAAVQWNAKVHNAIRVGASSVCLQQLQASDFVSQPREAGLGNKEFTCTKVKQYLTMQPLVDSNIVLHERFQPLVEWIHLTKYDWFVVLDGKIGYVYLML